MNFKVLNVSLKLGGRGLYMKVDRLLLIFGIPLAVIFGGGGLINTDNPDYYMYIGLLGSVFVIVSFIMKYYKKNQKQQNIIKSKNINDRSD